MGNEDETEGERSGQKSGEDDGPIHNHCSFKHGGVLLRFDDEDGEKGTQGSETQ